MELISSSRAEWLDMMRVRGTVTCGGSYTV
jgi:hypothetical protein